MKALLQKLIEGQTLTKEEACDTLVRVANGDFNDVQVASFLTVYMMRTITVAELEGFRDALLNLCVKVDLSEFDPIDLCGTGGDKLKTFNISTAASFVIAGAGGNVAKHGNRSISGVSGSADIFEYTCNISSSCF